MKKLFLFLLFSTILLAQNETIRRIEFNDSLNSIKTSQLSLSSGYLNGGYINGNVTNRIVGIANTPLTGLTTATDVFYGGWSAFENLTTGSYGVAIGRHAASKVTTANGVTAIGSDALGYGTGNYMTALGWAAGHGRISSAGMGSVLIGKEAGYQIDTLDNSVIIGTQAGYGLGGYYNGSDQTIVGNWAGFKLQKSYYNSIFGSQTGYNLTTGSNNTIIGFAAGDSVTTGNGNVFLGFRAGEGMTGSDNFAISNSGTTYPLMSGNFSNDSLLFNARLKLSAGNGYSPQLLFDGASGDYSGYPLISSLGTLGLVVNAGGDLYLGSNGVLFAHFVGSGYTGTGTFNNMTLISRDAQFDSVNISKKSNLDTVNIRGGRIRIIPADSYYSNSPSIQSNDSVNLVIGASSGGTLYLSSNGYIIASFNMTGAYGTLDIPNLEINSRSVISSGSITVGKVSGGSSVAIDSTLISGDSLFFYVAGSKYKAVKSEFPYWLLLGIPFFFIRRRFR